MAYPIKYLSLQKPELEYEVELRGGNGGSVSDLRKQIVKLHQDLPPEDILESHLSPDDDLKQVKESLSKSKNNLTMLKIKLDKNLFSRTETLLHHVYHRLNRIINTQDVNDSYKDCFTTFNLQFKELALVRQSCPSPGTSTSATDTNTEPSTISVTCDRGLSADINKLKYSGNTCVHSFIQRIEEFVQSRGISYDKILTLAYEIFVDDALHWYRYNKEKVRSWSELCALLKEDFSSSDYDYRFMSEIRSRTQGEQENITIYLSIMHGMFSRLNKPIPDTEKLEILMHNIRPCYANTLAASPSIKSIDELKSVCRNYETITARFSQFQEPPKPSASTLAPEFSYRCNSIYNNKNKFIHQGQYNSSKQYNQQYKYNDTFKKNNPNSNYNNNFGISALSSEQSRPLYCPRCRSNNHSLGSCSQERFLICFKCGKKDVRYPDCPNCNPTSKGEPPKN